MVNYLKELFECNGKNGNKGCAKRGQNNSDGNNDDSCLQWRMGILRYCSYPKTTYAQRFTPILDSTWIAYLQNVSIVSYPLLTF